MLTDLDLLGERFDPDALRRALTRYLELAIEPIADYPDLSEPILGGEVLKQGTLAEVSYEPTHKHATILIRESLKHRPWPTWELNAHHELAHLALDHQIRIVSADLSVDTYGFVPVAQRLIQRKRPEFTNERNLERLRQNVYEPEAQQWANWLVFAGNYPDLFKRERMNRAT